MINVVLGSSNARFGGKSFLFDFEDAERHKQFRLALLTTMGLIAGSTEFELLQSHPAVIEITVSDPLLAEKWMFQLITGSSLPLASPRRLAELALEDKLNLDDGAAALRDFQIASPDEAEAREVTDRLYKAYPAAAARVGILLLYADALAYTDQFTGSLGTLMRSLETGNLWEGHLGYFARIYLETVASH